MRSVERAGRILRLFSSEQPVLRVSLVGRALGIDRSSASRLMATMAAEGLLARDPGGPQYRPGPVVLQLAPLAVGRPDLAACATPHMRQLVALTRETVSLHVLVDSHRVCIDAQASPQELRSTVDVGRRRLLHAGAQGKVLLADLPAADLEVYIAAGLPAYTEATICDPARLREELRRVRAAGFALSFGESTPHVSSIAAPLRDATGATVAAIACSGPMPRWTREAMESWAPTLLATAAEISRALGHRSGQRSQGGNTQSVAQRP